MMEMTVQLAGRRTATSFELTALAKRIFRFDKAKRVTKECADPGMYTDHKAELLKKVEHGYIVEDTGERVCIPRFARAYVKTLLKNDGWA